MNHIIPSLEAVRLRPQFSFDTTALAPGDQDMLTRFLDFAARAERIIADQKDRIAQLELMTITDPLTGLLNRRGMAQNLDQAIATASRYDEPALFVYIDLDKFKGTNDRYGHAAGDAQLQFVASFLNAAIRKTDYAARIGGDEFALLLSHSDFSGGCHRVNFIQQSLHDARFFHHDHRIPTRASFGVAEITAQSRPDDIIRAADCQMYRQKSQTGHTYRPSV